MTPAWGAMCCELVMRLELGGRLSGQAMQQVLTSAAYSKHVALQANAC